MTLTRRDFVTGTAATLGLAALTRQSAVAATGPDVVDVSGSSPAAMVGAAVAALGGIGRFVKRGDYVVLKANAAFANPPEWGTTTHPETVVAMAKLCLEAGAKRVVVLEYPQAKGMKCLERCGLIAALAAVPAVQVKLLGAPDDFKEVKIPGGVACKSTEVAKALLSADVFINLPAAKAHDQTGVSLGLKNHMGLIRERQVFHTMMDLHQAVADLAQVVKPHLTLIDATRALLTNGPAGPGDTSTPGRMAAGTNVVSVDAYALTLARFNQRQMTPADARHIALAAAAGLGEADVAKLVVKKVTA